MKNAERDMKMVLLKNRDFDGVKTVTIPYCTYGKHYTLSEAPLKTGNIVICPDCEEKLEDIHNELGADVGFLDWLEGYLLIDELSQEE